MFQLYDEKEMLKGKLDLLSNTNMVDFAMDVHKTLYPDQEVPQGKSTGFKFNFFDSLLKLASGIIFYLLNLSANLLFHTYKHC